MGGGGNIEKSVMGVVSCLRTEEITRSSVPWPSRETTLLKNGKGQKEVEKKPIKPKGKKKKNLHQSQKSTIHLVL